MDDDLFFSQDDGPSLWYDVLQVCLNGHVTNDKYEELAINNKNFCDHCGQKTIHECPNCNTKIPGFLHARNVIGGSRIKTPPLYCANCGKAFPWQAKNLKSAKELIAESELDPKDIKIFQDSLEGIVLDGPETPVAATRIKKLLGKLGTGAGEVIYKVTVDIASETAKKIITGK